MNLLLDSHALLWWLGDHVRLGPAAREAIRAASTVAVSTASLWEIAIKTGLGKLRADPAEILLHLDRDGFEILAITPEDCLAVAHLPLHHGDPFDRMLVVQARSRGLTIVSDDARMTAYDVPVQRCAGSAASSP